MVAKDKLSWQFTRTPLTSPTEYTKSTYISSKNVATDDFTILTWIRTEFVGHGKNHYETMYIASAEVGGAAADWGFGVDKDGYLAFGQGQQDVTLTSTTKVNTKQWVQVAVTRVMTTGAICLYIDGTLDSTVITQNRQKLLANDTMLIGSGADGTAFSMGGDIGIVSVYTIAVAPTVIKSLFDVGRLKYKLNPK
jgi:hypothetical protein